MHARAVNSLRMPPVQDWETFPFEGEMHPRELLLPVDAEPSRHGANGIDCTPCSAPDGDFFWTSERWRARAMPPSGLPLILILQPRAHYAEPGDLPDDMAAELGVVMSRIERALRAVPHVGRIHIGRWGDGGEHLHWWFMARPGRFPQLKGNMAAIWDDVLPPVPEKIWRDNLAIVQRELSVSSA
jgi:diadenosine tetraphosphate (Ap4A) HIT family hydrolase